MVDYRVIVFLLVQKEQKLRNENVKLFISDRL